MKKLFTFLMIALAAFSASVSASAEELEYYTLGICGIQIDSYLAETQNLTRILTNQGYLQSGTVGFDPETFKLTLNDAVISCPNHIIFISTHGYSGYTEVTSLEISVNGNCVLETDASNSNISCIESIGNVTTTQDFIFTGNGSLTMTSGNIAFLTYNKSRVLYRFNGPDVTINGGNYGIYSTNAYDVKYEMLKGTVTVNGSRRAIFNFFNADAGIAGEMEFGDGMEIIEPEGGHLVFNPDAYSGGVMIQDGNNTPATHVKIGINDYGLKVGDIAVTSINRDDILGDGKVTYNPETNTLTLNNATITGEDCINVAKTLSGLKILVQGEVTLNATHVARPAIYFNNSDKAVIQGVSSNGEYAKLNINVPDGNYTTPAIYYISYYGNDEYRAHIKDIDIHIAGSAYIGSDNWDECLTVDNSNIISEAPYGEFYVIYDVQLVNCYVALPEGGYFDRGELCNAQGQKYSGPYQILRSQAVAVPGDVNGDGSCTSSDVTALYNYILYNDSSAIVNGDQNNDNSITASDVTAVYNNILGNNSNP